MTGTRLAGHRGGARRAWLAVALAVVGALSAGPAMPQQTECGRLYAAIQAADDTGDDGGAWSRAAQRQSAEIARTQRYADQLGCDDNGLFGGSGAPQCGEVMDRLQRMRNNLASLQSQAHGRAAGGGGRKAALVARYNSTCVGIGGGNPSDLGQRSDRGFLFDDGQDPADAPNTDDLSNVPLNGDIMDGAGQGGQSHGQAICVRTCDGGYFPLASHAADDQLNGLEQLCQASCPNTEAKLYTMPGDGDLSGATAVDGTPYTALPAAFRFEKSFAPTCTCKPPNQSWTQALGEAEKLLDQSDHHDIVVTAALSDQMAKPSAAPPASRAKPAKPVKGAKPLPVPVAPGPDLSVVHDGLRGMQAPTASNDTTGIGGPVQSERVVRQGDGPTISAVGPDGIKKRIRLIVP